MSRIKKGRYYIKVFFEDGAIFSVCADVILSNVHTMVADHHKRCGACGWTWSVVDLENGEVIL